MTKRYTANIIEDGKASDTKPGTDQSSVTGKVYTANFLHCYTAPSFSISDMASSRHTCLREGYWCWSNLVSHPLDLLSYLKKKLHP